jgi:hypothetical protein
MRAAGVPSGVSSTGASCMRSSSSASAELSKSGEDSGARGAGACSPGGAAGGAASSLCGGPSGDEDPPQSGRSGSAWPASTGARAVAAGGTSSGAGGRLRSRLALVDGWPARSVELCRLLRGVGVAVASAASVGALAWAAVRDPSASSSWSAAASVWSGCVWRTFFPARTGARRGAGACRGGGSVPVSGWRPVGGAGVLLGRLRRRSGSSSEGPGGGSKSSASPGPCAASGAAWVARARTVGPPVRW